MSVKDLDTARLIIVCELMIFVLELRMPIIRFLLGFII